MKKTLCPVLAVSLIALCMLPGIASADVMLKQKHHTDSYQIMGNKMPAKDSIETIWMTKDGFSSEGDDHCMIFRVDKKHGIYHREKRQDLYGAVAECRQGH